jgi:hypothetical protein
VRKTLEELLAEAAIRDVQIRYCRAVDRMDFDLLRSCFHPDASADYGFFKGGVDAFVEMAVKELAAFTGTVHFTGNQLVEVDGDRAWAEHYTTATHRCPADENGPLRDYVAIVRYVDRMERRDGDWRIARRILILDSSRTDPVPDLGPGARSKGARRDRSDPSYSLR